ncbi:GNAT family N-acetyltransferase [Dactylosporangium sp. NPDC048998]|uniref:GNAT family N-acetyltransferase n=1 Tax=Dactylosporangium sp. NPDC048998 TaxID=3363976 RepID=UPI0037202C8E
MNGALRIRPAAPADTDLVTGIITGAFAADPLWSHALARPDGDTSFHPAYWRLFVDGALRYPTTRLAGDGQAVAVWIPPGGTEFTDEGEAALEALVADHLSGKAAELTALLELFAAARPAQPHYYLTLLGTHPHHRGHGIGMDLLRANLAEWDAEGVPAYLESSNPANNKRYAGVGFRPRGGFAYPHGGPVVTTMWREPAH